MNAIAAITVLLLSLAAVHSRGIGEDQSLSRDKRDVWSGIIGTAACLPKVTAAAQACGKDLDEKIKGRENDDSQDMKCCIYAEFRRCVTAVADEHCDKDAAPVVETVIKGIQSTLNKQCDEYKFYSPTCITIIYFNYILIGAIVSILLSIGCCLGSCCCRR